MLRTFAIISLVLSLITIGIWSQSDRIRRWLDPDVIRVELHGRLQYQGLEIYWQTESSLDSILVYQSAKQVVQAFPVRGSNVFSVYYQGAFIGSIDHFKTDKDHSHSYYYIIEEQEGNIELVDVAISGMDAHQ